MPALCLSRPIVLRLLGLLVLVASPGRAQDSTSRASLGIRGIGGFALLPGYSRVERGVSALEIGAVLDLGHFTSRRVRLAAEVNYLRSFRFSEYVEAEDSTYRDAFYDLSPRLWLQLLARDPVRRIVPFARFGVGVHALTSTFGSIPLDIRYNTNVFGLATGAGLRLRVPGAKAIVIEGTAIVAKEVSRGGLRMGLEWLPSGRR